VDKSATFKQVSSKESASSYSEGVFMRRILTAAAVPFALIAVGSSSAASGGGNGLPAGHKDKNVCTKSTSPTTAGCDAKIVTLSDGVTPFATSGPTGYGPSDLLSAYNLKGLSSGATVAIVDAYANPNVASDLAAYRAQYGISCSGCLTVVNQNGAASPLPSGNTGWGQEIDLDVDMVSAICPTCHILLVEANSNSFADLGAAVNYAASQHPAAISNSYGTSGEFSGETSYDSSYYNHPNIAVTASSGDSGYGVEFPAASNHVVAVGGTSLTGSSTTGWSESAWNGAGSGCSSYFSQPTWQATFNTGCSNRAEADVSAVADPNTGVAVYDSYGSSGSANWYVFGGTSVASPIIASVFGLAGNANSFTYPASHIYGSANSSNMHDVTSGSNGNCVRRHGWRTSGSSQLCTAGTGWDGPTGLGTPNGTSAF
jgi:subtilase family serine protease